MPNPTGNVAEDAVYEGWLYAIVSTPGGALDGIFVTKDFGQNWTDVRIPTEPNQGYQNNPAIPANDVTLANYSVIGSAQFPQGNYNQAIAVDPSDPSILYVGGTTRWKRIRTDPGRPDRHLGRPLPGRLILTMPMTEGDLTLASTGPATVGPHQVPSFSQLIP